MKLLVTGVAGFIGMHTALRLLDRGEEVLGIDNLNNYYDVSLKEARLVRLTAYPNFHFIKMDITCREEMAMLFRDYHPWRVIHLATQAGVRYSIENPHAYIDSNITGFINILEGCRHQGTKPETKSKKHRAWQIKAWSMGHGAPSTLLPAFFSMHVAPCSMHFHDPEQI